jgi:hypothetical protein
MAVFTLSDVNDTLMSQNRTLKSTDKKVGDLSSNMKTFLEVMKGKKLKAREEAIEGGATPAPKGGGANAATSGLFGGIGAALAGLTGTLSTMILGLTGTLLASFDETFNDISRTFAASFLDVGGKIKALLKASFVSPVLLFADTFRDTTKIFDEATLRWRNIDTGKFTKAPSTISIMIDRIANFFTNTFGEESKLGKMFAKIKGAFTIADDSPLMKIVDKVSPMFKTLGGILKKIFLPIGLIFTAYDTVKGAIEGYEKDGIEGAIGGAIGGLLSSIVGAPLNLLKSAVSWVLEKFGFGEASKYLDELDFEKMLKDLGEGFGKFLKAPFETLKEGFKAILPEKVANLIFGGSPAEELAEKEERIKALEADIADGKNVFQSQRDFVKQKEELEKLKAEVSGIKPTEKFQKGTLGALGELFHKFNPTGEIVQVEGEEAIVPKNSEHGKVLQDYEEKKNTYNFNKPKGFQGKAVSAKPKMPTAAGVMPEGMGGFLGKLMDQSKPMMGLAHQKGKELKAKEDAMRAAGASDMDIAQSMMGDMGGMLGSLKNLAPKIDLSQAPKMKSNPIKEALAPNNLGNTFGSIVREAEENKEKRATQSSPAPVIISDNSSKSSSTSNTAMPIISKPYDFDDPFVSGIGRTRGL